MGVLLLLHLSLLSRKRGLKFSSEVLGFRNDPVASFAEAWIEMRHMHLTKACLWSLLSRKRGLKLNIHQEKELKWRSLLSRKRGLKYFMFSATYTECRVASFAEAWIEIMVSTTR